MLTLFVDVVLPVFVVAATGYLGHRLLSMQVQTLSAVTLYIFSPALVLSSLTRSTLSAQEALQIVGFALSFAAIMYLLSWIAAKLFRLGRELESAFLLSTLFMNSGNYGLSVALLAFGEEGLQRALIFFVLQAIMGGTLAVFVASRSSLGLMASVGSVLRIPHMYAALSALAINATGVPLPSFIANSAEILGRAAIPAMLIVLGMQLGQRLEIEYPGALAVAVSMRLIFSAGMALGLTQLIGIGDLTQKVLIVQASMPTAVFAVIVATQFNARPRFVAGAVILSTLASILTITLLLAAVTGKIAVF